MYDKILEKLLEEKGGLIVSSEARKAGVSKDALYRFVGRRGLERQSHGVYVDPEAFPDEFALLQARYPKAVFSHETALYLHDMAEREPVPLSVTVESGYNAPSLKKQGVRVYYVKPEWHDLGVCEASTPEGNLVRAYDRERTICDAIRRRSSMDVASFNYALRTYVASKDRNLARLSDYARKMNMEARVWDAMGVLL